MRISTVSFVKELGYRTLTVENLSLFIFDIASKYRLWPDGGFGFVRLASLYEKCKSAHHFVIP
jgi:hypothetical protein